MTSKINCKFVWDLLAGAFVGAVIGGVYRLIVIGAIIGAIGGWLFGLFKQVVEKKINSINKGKLSAKNKK